MVYENLTIVNNYTPDGTLNLIEVCRQFYEGTDNYLMGYILILGIFLLYKVFTYINSDNKNIIFFKKRLSFLNENLPMTVSLVIITLHIQLNYDVDDWIYRTILGIILLIILFNIIRMREK